MFEHIDAQIQDISTFYQDYQTSNEHKVGYNHAVCRMKDNEMSIQICPRPILFCAEPDIAVTWVIRWGRVGICEAKNPLWQRQDRYSDRNGMIQPIRSCQVPYINHSAISSSWVVKVWTWPLSHQGRGGMTHELGGIDLRWWCWVIAKLFMSEE